MRSFGLVVLLAITVALATSGCGPTLRYCKSFEACAVDCPEQTDMRKGTPDDPSVYCQRATGAKHGPFVKLKCEDSGCYQVEKGQYLEGKRHGRWNTLSHSIRKESVNLRPASAERRIETINMLKQAIRSNPSFMNTGAIKTRLAKLERGEGGTKETEIEEIRFMVHEYVRGVRNGEWKSWFLEHFRLREHTDESLSRAGKKLAYVGSFSNGNGAFSEWYKSGGYVRKRSTGRYKDNLPDGIWTTWHENGQKKREGSFAHGVEEGEWKEWSATGNLIFAGGFSKGKRHGQGTAYWTNGVYGKGSFSEGHPDGEWKFYDKSGPITNCGKSECLPTYYDAGQLRTVPAEIAHLVKCSAFETCVFDCPDGAPNIRRRNAIFCSSNGKKLGPATTWRKLLVAPSFDTHQFSRKVDLHFALEDYTDYRPDGTHRFHAWYPNGQKRVEANWMGRARHGKTEAWHPNGRKKYVAYYDRNREDGTHEYWFENGQKRKVANYGDGERVGQYKEWYANGSPKEVSYWLDSRRKDGIYQTWHENGQKKESDNYKDGQRDGVQEEWHENGNRVYASTYKNGSCHGKSETWYENGQKKSETNYVGGKKHGKHITWHENGQKKEQESYKDGEEHGKATAWYDNGKKKYAVQLVADLAHGPAAYWHRNGRKRAEGRHEEGEEVGTWKRWTEDGRRVKEEVEDEDDYSDPGEYTGNAVCGRGGNFNYCCSSSSAKLCLYARMRNLKQYTIREKGRLPNMDDGKRAAAECDCRVWW